MTHQQMMDMKDGMLKAFGDGSILFVWTTGPYVEFTYQLIRHWGWSPATIAFTWIKLNRLFKPKTTDQPVEFVESSMKTGLGKWTRPSSEFVIAARRNAPLQRVSGSVPQVIISPIGEHSAKPDEVQTRIEQLLRRPDDECFELFARRKFNDWTCTGLDLDGLDVMVALDKIASGERW
jgi:N6-adenosine-specific RNA methylase IME4